MGTKIKSSAADLDLKADGEVTVLFNAELPPSRQDAAILDTPMTLERLKLDRVLGRSDGATVFAVTDKTTQQQLALKVHAISGLTPLTQHQIIRGSRIHTACSAHPHALPLYFVFQDAANVYQLMALGKKGDLFVHMESRGRHLTPGQAVKYVVKPLLSLLEYMHTRSYIHRDIKPENLLMGEDNTVLLADFDLATDAQQETPCTQVGTADYMAPEVLKCSHKSTLADKSPNWLKYSMTVDVWAVGVLVWEMLTGQAPFTGTTREAIKANVTNKQLVYPAWSKNCKTFVESCLQRDVRKRPNAKALLQHAWLADPNT